MWRALGQAAMEAVLRVEALGRKDMIHGHKDMEKDMVGVKDTIKALKEQMQDLYILHIMKVIQDSKRRHTEKNNG